MRVDNKDQKYYFYKMKRFRDTEYFVSEDGNIFRNGRMLKKVINSKGYCIVCLSVNGVINNHYIHRMVGELYLDNPSNLPEIDHKDTIKTNNHFSNLEWVTSRENKRRAKLNDLYHTGLNHHNSILNQEMIDFIKNNYKRHDRKLGGNALAKKFNVHPETISRLINNKTYQ